MKLRHLMGISTLFMLLLVIHACSTDYKLSEEDAALEILEPEFIISQIKHCKYNVTKSSVVNITDTDQVCFPCAAPCASTITDRPFTVATASGTDSIIGKISGDSGTGHSRCRSCNSGSISSS